MAVDPNDAIDRNELADRSSSSVASSGIRLSWAGSKNCLTPALSRIRAYNPTTAMDSIPITNAMSVTMTACTRQVPIRIRLRSCRSTYTPASRPTTRLGRAVAMSVNPTASADPVSRYTKIPAARSVSEEPAVDTSWASQSKLKSRFRKTANMDGAGAAAAVIGSPGGRGGRRSR
jgi:hypothetical protein